MLTFRTFREDEAWPADLNMGFERMPRAFIQHDWIFVVEDGGRILGMLMVTPAHGIAIFIRMAVASDAPAKTMWMLLRHTFAELKLRGYHLWVSLFDTSQPNERQLYRACRAWGAQQWPSPTVVMMGLTSKKRVDECHS